MNIKSKDLPVLSLSIIGILLTLQTGSEAGSLDMMRGPQQVPVKEYRRVAVIGAGEVKQIQGTVERLCGIDWWKPVAPGEKLEPGDLIRTGNGSVILKMRESESFVRITPKTMMRFVQFEEAWDHGIVSGVEERNGFVVRS